MSYFKLAPIFRRDLLIRIDPTLFDCGARR